MLRQRHWRIVIWPVPMLEGTDAMAPTRYEIRVNGTLSERERSAFCTLAVTSIPPQTIVFGDLAEVDDLADLLTLCGAMGLEVVSLRRLPDAAAGLPSIPMDDVGSGVPTERRAEPGDGPPTLRAR